MSTKKTITTSEALSIIEVLVSGALIGSVLTALAVNMIYTQRMVEDIKARSKAVDQVYTCLAKFRAMRDMEANTWPYFCGKMINFANNVDGRNGKREIKYSGKYYRTDKRIKTDMLDGTVTICAMGADANPENTYTVKFLNKDGGALAHDDGSGIKEACKNRNYPGYVPGSEGFYVRVIVKYVDAVGRPRTVSAQEKFIRGGVDPEFCPQGSTSDECRL